MTGNQIKGKGFRGALRYNLDKVERNVAEVLDHSFVDASEKSIMKEIQLVRILRPNLPDISIILQSTSRQQKICQTA